MARFDGSSLFLLAPHLHPVAAFRLSQACRSILANFDEELWRIVHDSFFGGPLLPKCRDYRTSCAAHARNMPESSFEAVATWAALYGHHCLVFRLLRHSSVSPELLSGLACSAASRGRCEVLTVLSGAGCDLTAASALHTKRQSGKPVTPLEVATKGKHHSAISHIATLTAPPEEALIHHVQASNVTGVKRALNAGAEIARTSNATGGTALHSAACLGDLHVLDLLLACCNEATLNVLDSQARTALVCAIDASALDVVKRLLGAGATSTFLMERKQLAESLVHDAALNRIRLPPCSVLRAVEADSPECVQLLLEAGAQCLDPVGKKNAGHALVRACGYKNWHHAIGCFNIPQHGCADSRLASGLQMCTLLLESGVDANARDLWGNTALHMVASCTLNHPSDAASNHLIVWMQLLIEYNADVNAVNDNGISALAIAAALHGKGAEMRWLIEKGACCTMPGQLHLATAAASRNALLASGVERWERFQFLISLGASPDDRHNGRTLISHLCICSRERCTGSLGDGTAAEDSTLIQHAEADVKIATALFTLGATARTEHLRDVCSPDLCRCLVEVGGLDPNFDPQDGLLLPLHDQVFQFAQASHRRSRASHLQVIRQLLQCGANPNAISSCDGSNALVSMIQAIVMVSRVHPCFPQWRECEECVHIWQACEQLLEVLLPLGASFEGHSFDRDWLSGAFNPCSCHEMLGPVPSGPQILNEIVNANTHSASAGTPAWKPGS